MPRRSVFRDADRLFGLQLAGLGLLTLAACVIGGLLMDRLITRPVYGMWLAFRTSHKSTSPTLA